ncbi:MAG: hypothetical protein OIF50_11460 [Flavobacteriaceae bacterium]|nr:hypothetical protein [Flavobacteriaceae bacterium]
MKAIRNFVVLLALVLGIAMLLHIGVLVLDQQNWMEHLFLESYIANYLVTVLIFVLLYIWRIKYHNQIGFLFLGGTLLKFAVFFVFFAPTYRADDKIQTLEFLAFFVPYALCLLVETWRIIRLVNDKK